MTRQMGMAAGVLILAALAVSCRHRGDERAHEPPTANVTHWTEKSELYMEYPPLVAGRAIRLAVHLTRLNDFQALAAGTPAIEFTPEQGGQPTVLRGSPPSPP